MKISTYSILAVLPAVADKDVRHYLNGAHVRAVAGAIVVEATNGHAYHRMQEASPDPETLAALQAHPAGIIFKLDAPTIAAMKKQVGGHVLIKGMADDYLSAEMLEVADSKGNTVHIQPNNPIIEGKFPDCDRVWSPRTNTSKAGFPGTLNPVYLAALQQTAKNLRCKLSGVRFYQTKADTDGPAYFELHLGGGNSMHGAIMPVRI